MAETAERRPGDRGGAQVVMSATEHRVQRPRRLTSVWAELPFVRRASVAQRREWYDTINAARQTARQRRDRVLRHPDIAARLLTVGYRDPGHWNGYVPPTLDSDGARNDSPQRAELVAILRAVADREAAA